MTPPASWKVRVVARLYAMGIWLARFAAVRL
jgi:hypothetical protein